MVDRTRVLRLLRALADDVATLRGEASADPSRRADPMWLPGVKYRFVTAVEACVDIAQHICSSEGWGPPRDNGDAMRVLARHGVLDAQQGTRMSHAVGFRNVLVHQYIEVDDRVVLERLQDLSDLDQFARAVARFVG